MMYPNLFRSRYQLQGRDWLRRIEPEDVKAFIDIGLQAADHGRAGGLALVKQRGREYMATIGRRGAVVANIKRQWIKAVQEETERL